METNLGNTTRAVLLSFDSTTYPSGGVTETVFFFPDEFFKIPFTGCLGELSALPLSAISAISPLLYCTAALGVLGSL